MLTVYPDYYRSFRCVAGSCRHTCCIGWEIDIDPEKLAFYHSVPGELGRRLREHISLEGEPHFILGEGERCPFLNDRNLCDIITQLGEEHICQICTDHPRFYHTVPQRLEMGLGLCCEEAGRLILGKKEPSVLLEEGFEEEKDPVLVLRDEALVILGQRELSLEQRLERVLALCDAEGPHGDMGRWAAFLLGLERLEAGWTELLEKLEKRWRQAPVEAFLAFLGPRTTEYEHLAAYLFYRHLPDAWDDADLAARAAFGAFGCGLLVYLGALAWQERGEFSFSDQVELARMFSSEIEYSEENLERVLEELLPAWACQEL